MLRTQGFRASRMSPAVLIGSLAGFLASSAAHAAEQGASADLPPLQCWWRTDRAAVHVGEQLLLTLTCAASETETATALPEWDQLQPEAIELAPFEVVGGARSEDVVTGNRRYTQFEYTLRLTGEEFFGQDVPLPSLEIIYSIAVGQPGGSMQQGRERTYVLPPLPMKIVSLVPAQANDIEDVAGYSLAAIERRRSRAAMAFVVGCGLVAAGALCLFLFLGSVFNQIRTQRAAAPFRVADWRLVLGCCSTLRQLASAARRDGWTDARVGEALALLRVLGAIAIGTPVRQRIVARGEAAESGEWLLRRLSLRRSRIGVTATVTAAQLGAQSFKKRRALSAQAVDVLAAAIAACSDVRYAQGDADGGSLAEVDRAISDVLSVSRELSIAALLPVRLTSFAARHAATGAS